MKLLSQYKRLGSKRHRYFILTGGRGSGKSFHVSAFLVNLTYEPGHVILFTRYTMRSAYISIIPEYREKIEMLGLERDFSITKDEIVNLKTGSRILFRGLKTSEGTQTANLKSIQGVTTWVLDEAEELVDESVFDTIDLSIRTQQTQNRVILILNPSHKQHWIYKRFIGRADEDAVVIHTTYLDNLQNLSDSFIKSANKTKANNPEKYNHVYLGHWRESRSGLIHKVSGYVDAFPDPQKIVYGLDFGWNDPAACVAVQIHDGAIYVQERLYASGLSPERLASGLLAAQVPTYAPIYADSADPGKIDLLRGKFSRIMPAFKEVGSVDAGLTFINDHPIYIVGDSPNLRNEIESYSWKVSRDGLIMDGVPEPGADHLMDAMRYAIYSHYAKRLTAAKSGTARVK